MSREGRIKAALAEGTLDVLFLGELGWDRPRIASFTVEAVGTRYTVSPVAQKSGLHVFDIETPTELPSAAVQAVIDREIAKRSPERLLVFRSQAVHVWRWPESRPSGGTRLVPHEYGIESPNEDLVQRIARISFSPEEQEGLTLPDVRARVRQSLSAEQVTKRFYDAFRTQHADLLAGIEGIDDEQDRSWYASLLMNRLMFIYFLQMKGFIAGNRDFLQGCLRAIRGIRGRDEFYAFYRDLLIPLFHEGLGSSGTIDAGADIGFLLEGVPYINGGIFESHPIEERYEIRIRDTYFERILEFFDSFAWHLDTSPTGNPNEINPDVIGYVFEQYINLTTSGKREKGAYYTKEDVTGYMVSVSLVPFLLERLIARTGANPFLHLVEHPDRYIHESLLHGWDPVEERWLDVRDNVTQLWAEPLLWSELDSEPADPAVVLPGETWVEALDRRERVDRLRETISAGELESVDALVTSNLDGRTLLVDAVRSLSSPDDVLAYWTEVSSTAVLDPTCGSGAFLFAALEVLDDVYGAILETAELHLRSGFPRAREALSEITQKRSPNQNSAYFCLKHAAVSNLYGLDLMPEAVEIAKLRLFLTLAARLDRPEEIEPLPDLDFNIRAGNLLVGFRNLDDAQLRVACDLVSENAIKLLMPDAEILVRERDAFVDAIEESVDSQELAALKGNMLAVSDVLRRRADEIYFAAEGHSDPGEPVSDGTLREWQHAASPFHWFIEFPHVIARGGFDVVIGNPPYITTSSTTDLGYSRLGYATNAAPDLYATCVERAESLRRAPAGHLCMIVMLSAAFSADFASLRNVLRESSDSVWWSTYSRLPDGLFAGNARIRNTIIALQGVGGSPHRDYVTRHNVWASEWRPHLFHTIEYFPQPVERLDAVPARAGRARNVVFRCLELARKAAPGGRGVLCRPTGQYWVPVLPGPVPVLDEAGEPQGPDTRVKAFGSVDPRLVHVAVALSASSIGYAWWSAFGDDFDFTQEVVAGLIERVVPALASDERVLDAATELVHDAWCHGFYTLNAGKGYINIRYPDLRTELASFDQLIVERLGLSASDFRDLQIWYRQVMRGWAPGPKTRRLKESIVTELQREARL